MKDLNELLQEKHELNALYQEQREAHWEAIKKQWDNVSKFSKLIDEIWWPPFSFRSLKRLFMNLDQMTGEHDKLEQERDKKDRILEEAVARIEEDMDKTLERIEIFKGLCRLFNLQPPEEESSSQSINEEEVAL